MTLPVSSHAAAIAASPFDPLSLAGRPLAVKLALVFLGTLLLTASSWISVPMLPVPITMQTFALTMIGMLYGWRLGMVTVLAWLGEAAVGLPVLAGGAGGLAHFAGPTAGYLAAFPVMTALAGWLAARGWTGRRIVLSFAAHLSANLLCLVMGWAWLADLIGPQKAFLVGVLPFLIGALLKSALAAATLALWDSSRRKAETSA